jgi:hypothetical protein
MPTQSTPTWSHLQPHLQRLDKAALVDLLRDLHELNADNRTFLAARFLATTPSEAAAPYRRIVRQVFNPSRGAPSLHLDAAAKALRDFRKLCADPMAVIDFMLFYVEQGVICTNSYGDIDAPFYENLLSVYSSAAELAGSQTDAVIEQLRPRFAKIVPDTGKIGWGFHEGLEQIYWDLLPEPDGLK